jgi:hypothetical protein
MTNKLTQEDKDFYYDAFITSMSKVINAANKEMEEYLIESGHGDLVEE